MTYPAAELTTPEYAPDMPMDAPEMAPDEPIQETTHLDLSEAEKRRLSQRIERDHTAAQADHQKRVDKFKLYFSWWRSNIGMAAGQTGASNYKVPMVEWQILAKLANMVDSVFGEDAEIVAEPVSPNDARIAPKISAYMTWLVFSAMQAKSAIITFLFRVLLYGRAFAYVPYEEDRYESDGQSVCEYAGPKFYPMQPDEFITPAEEVCSLHEFSFVERVYYETPEQLLAGEDSGRYAPGSISNNFERIYKAARQEKDPDSISSQNAEIEGVSRVGSSPKGTVKVQEWYGSWRMLKGEEDASEDDFEKRDIRETDLLVRKIYETEDIISAQKLADLYPRMRERRPFVEMPLQDTGEYWCKSYPEMLVDAALEITVNHNIRTEAVEAAAFPPIGVKPSQYQQITQARWKPRQIFQLENPATDMIQLRLNPNIEGTVVQEQSIMSYVERLTGISDQQLGRAIDRPNAPRTARGQIALMSKGDVRLNLDNITMREYFSKIIGKLWLLDSSFSEEKVFFRVTEEKANGLFDNSEGFSELNPDERGGRYDFRLKFATSSLSREAEREKAMMLAQIALATPLVAQDPAAQWRTLQGVYKAQGKDFRDVMAEPPPLNSPKTAKEEWALMLQGETVHTHPLDNDDEHIAEHQLQIGEEMHSKTPDLDATERGLKHIVEHEVNKQRKLVAQEQVKAQMAMAAQAGMDPALLGAGGEQGQPMQPQAQPMGLPQAGEVSGDEMSQYGDMAEQFG